MRICSGRYAKTTTPEAARSYLHNPTLLCGIADGVVAGLLMLLCIGFILVLAVAVVDVVLVILAAIKVNDGYHYRYPYPLIIRFIK